MTNTEWDVWQPATEADEVRFCALVCSECSKSRKNASSHHIGCQVLQDTINSGGTQILFNQAAGKIRCEKQKIESVAPTYRCKNTVDMFSGTYSK